MEGLAPPLFGVCGAVRKCAGCHLSGMALFHRGKVHPHLFGCPARPRTRPPARTSNNCQRRRMRTWCRDALCASLERAPRHWTLRSKERTPISSRSIRQLQLLGELQRLGDSFSATVLATVLPTSSLTTIVRQGVVRSHALPRCSILFGGSCYVSGETGGSLRSCGLFCSLLAGCFVLFWLFCTGETGG